MNKIAPKKKEVEEYKKQLKHHERCESCNFWKPKLKSKIRYTWGLCLVRGLPHKWTSNCVAFKNQRRIVRGGVSYLRKNRFQVDCENIFKQILEGWRRNKDQFNYSRAAGAVFFLKLSEWELPEVREEFNDDIDLYVSCLKSGWAAEIEDLIIIF